MNIQLLKNLLYNITLIIHQNIIYINLVKKNEILYRKYKNIFKYVRIIQRKWLYGKEKRCFYLFKLLTKT